MLRGEEESGKVIYPSYVLAGNVNMFIFLVRGGYRSILVL
jgi:hypothetical protein